MFGSVVRSNSFFFFCVFGEKILLFVQLMQHLLLCRLELFNVMVKILTQGPKSGIILSNFIIEKEMWLDLP